MRIAFTFGLLVCVFLHCSAQKCNCLNADSVFAIGGKKFALCGFKVVINSEVLFAEGELWDCSGDTLIKKWGALDEYAVLTKDDTLIVGRFVQLYLAKNMEPTIIPWSVNKFFFDRYRLKMTSYLHWPKKIGSKYDVKSILKRYRSLNTEEPNMYVANQLFLGAIMGNKQAKKYLSNFKHKWKMLDGAYLEEYNTLLELYHEWEKQ